MWLIEYFESQPGKSPVHDFIQNLEPVAKAKIIDTFNLLQEFGIKLGLPHCKKLSGTPLYELRLLGQNNIRIFYITIPSQKFLLLHGFIKKTNETPKKEMATALKRWQVYKSSH
jgi:phage-related protein